MGTIYRVGCRDCKVTRDLDKFYSMQVVKNAEDVLRIAEDIKDVDSVRAALLASFMWEHKGHNCTVFNEHDENISDEFNRDSDEDFWADLNVLITAKKIPAKNNRIINQYDVQTLIDILESWNELSNTDKDKPEEGYCCMTDHRHDIYDAGWALVDKLKLNKVNSHAYGTCQKCGSSNIHETVYNTYPYLNGQMIVPYEAVLVLCTTCWSEMSIDERIKYHRACAARWGWPPEKAELVYVAVLEGA